MLRCDTDVVSHRVWVADGIALINDQSNQLFSNTPATSGPPVYSVVAGLNGTFWPLGIYHVEDAVNKFRGFGYDTEAKITYKTSDAKYDESRDWRRYGGISGQLNRALQLLSTGEFSSNTRNEYETYHPNYVGRVTPDLDIAPLEHNPAYYESVTKLWGQQWFHYGCVVPSSVTYFSDRVAKLSNAPTFTLDRPELAWKGYHTSIGNRAEYMKTYPLNLSTVYSSPWGVYINVCTPYQCTITPTRVEYKFYTTWSLYTYYWGYDCTLILNRTVHALTPTESMEVGPWYTLANRTAITAQIQWEMTSRHLIDPWGFYSPSVGQTGVIGPWTVNHDPMFMSETGSAKVSQLGVDSSMIRRSRIRENFVNEVSRYRGDIRLSAFNSTVDAWNALDAGIGTNLVEALGEIDEIATLGPYIAEAIRDLGVLSRRYATIARFSDQPWYKVIHMGTPIRDVISFATGIQLFVSFALTPSINLFIGIIPKLQSLVEQLGGNTPKLINSKYGTMSFDFPQGEFGRDEARLVTRTKITYESNLQQVLQTYLDVRSLGLTPTPGLVWDLQPFSFVVDWVLRIGDRIRLLEDAGAILPVSILNLVHTFSVFSPFTDAELAKLGYVNAPGVKSGVRDFKREVSTLLPTPALGRWDYLAAPFGPWVTASSLLYQLFQGRRHS